MPTGFPVGLALAPALAGAISLFLGIFAATRLIEPKLTADEAALRLFAAFFLLFGFWFLSDAVRNLRAALTDGGRRPASLAWMALATLVVGAIAAPFNFAWTAPWTLFQSLVFALDLIFVALLLRTIQLAWQRRRSLPPTAPAARSAARSLIRQRRLTFAAILFGSLGGLVGWLGAQQATADWNMWSRLLRVDGAVTRQLSFNFRGREGRPAPNAAVVVRYQVDGKGHETIQRIDPATTGSFGRGARVQLVYDPSSPERARMASPYDAFLISGALLMLCVVFLGIAGMCGARAAATRV